MDALGRPGHHPRRRQRDPRPRDPAGAALTARGWPLLLAGCTPVRGTWVGTCDDNPIEVEIDAGDLALRTGMLTLGNGRRRPLWLRRRGTELAAVWVQDASELPPVAGGDRAAEVFTMFGTVERGPDDGDTWTGGCGEATTDVWVSGVLDCVLAWDCEDEEQKDAAREVLRELHRGERDAGDGALWLERQP